MGQLCKLGKILLIIARIKWMISKVEKQIRINTSFLIGISPKE